MMRPEEAFVVASARVLAGTAARDSVQCPRGLDWQRVRAFASEHRITVCVEADSLERLRWNLLLSGELLKVLELFERNGIAAIPFKGPALASVLYGDAAMRESCDLDILVRPVDIQRSQELLVAKGYSTDLPADDRQRAAYIRSRYELHFTTPSHGIPIEIHQSFVAGSYCVDLDYEELWRRAERIPFFGREILSLSARDLLLMLSIHGAKHSWAEMVHICDITRLLVTRGSEIPWAELLAQTRSQGVSRIVRVGLLLASRLLHAPVPAGVLDEAAADLSAIQLFDEAYRSLLGDGQRTGAFGQYLLFLRMRERLRDRLAFMTSLTCNPNEEDYSRLKLPAFLCPLYVPLHAMRVAGKYGRAMLRDGAGN